MSLFLSSIGHRLVIHLFAQSLVLLRLILFVSLVFGLIAVWHYSRNIRSFGSFGTTLFYSRYTLISDLVTAIITTLEIYSYYSLYLIELCAHIVYVSRFSHSICLFILTPPDRTKCHPFQLGTTILIYIREDEEYELNRKSLAAMGYI